MLIPHTLHLSVRHILLCYCVYSVMIMQKKFKNASETDSNIPLYSVKCKGRLWHISHRPMGIHHSLHTNPIPISMEIPMGISIPTAARRYTCCVTLGLMLSDARSPVLRSLGSPWYVACECHIPSACMWAKAMCVSIDWFSTTFPWVDF